MEFLSMFLPIVLYFLASILLIILIVLSLKIIKVMNKLEVLTDDISRKVSSLNSFFNVIDNFTDKISLISDKMVVMATSLLSKIFGKKRKDDKDE